MRKLTGTAPDGRRAWLLSARRQEWVLVDEQQHQELKRLHQRTSRIWILLPLFLMLALLLMVTTEINGPVFALPWLWVLLLLGRNLWWLRRLGGAGERQVGGVRFLLPPDFIPTLGATRLKWSVLLLAGALALLMCLRAMLGHEEAGASTLFAALLLFGLAWALLEHRWMYRLAASQPDPLLTIDGTHPNGRHA